MGHLLFKSTVSPLKKTKDRYISGERELSPLKTAKKAKQFELSTQRIKYLDQSLDEIRQNRRDEASIKITENQYNLHDNISRHPSEQ